nr:IPT/TIG domain-containing protein [uncultured Allomuricauda sp.]
MKNMVLIRLFMLSLIVLALGCGSDDSVALAENDGPTIRGFSPLEGEVGETIWITGKNFGSTSSANTVKIGSVVAPISSSSTAEIFVTVPEGTVSGAISVTVDGKTDTAGIFTVMESLTENSISLNKNTLELFTLDSETLVPTFMGTATATDIEWTSEDEAIAIVDDNGKITGMAEGSTFINAFISEEVSTNCIVTVSPSVFAVGYETIDDIRVAKIWKNGVPANLTDGTKFGVATSVFVDATNIYVSGIESNQNDLPSAKVWKNGESLYTLSDASNYGVAHSIYVFEGNIYVTGSETDENDKANATIWENGVTYATLTDGMGGSLGSGIFVNETNIYTAGYLENQQHENGTPKLWKNTVQENLTDETYHGRANAVYAVGTDVFVAGYEENDSGISIAKFWKNGEVTDLTDGLTNAEANSIFVLEEDVYVAGGYYDDMENTAQAIIWKNDSPTKLGMVGSAASSVYVYGEGVYVGGYESNGGVAKAIVWKNQIPMDLTLSEGAGESAILSVFVK